MNNKIKGGKKMDILKGLEERGFVKQCSNRDTLTNGLMSSKIVFYAGFDPTADSLHAGSLVPIMAMANLQKAGHVPIAILGGGTALIGDPSGKTEMRKMLSREEIDQNGVKIRQQINKYLSFGEDKGYFLNNADWLIDLNYIEFLRRIGKFFKVNEMIKNEGYRLRLEREEGLSFIEFNYQLLQAYDFLVLFEKYGCALQVGGDDQWGNILAGTNLIHQIKGKMAFALTFPLILTANGRKMGKTETGTVWLDPKKTSPYDFYQYWINTDDRDVIRFLKLFTFLPMEEIDELAKLRNEKLREAKEVLAFEATKLTHGEEEAQRARKASKSIFAGVSEDASSLPTTVISKKQIVNGLLITELLHLAKIVSSKGEGIRLIKQGGAYINDKKIDSAGMTVTENLFKDDSLLLRKGKKQYHRVMIGKEGG